MHKIYSCYLPVVLIIVLGLSVRLYNVKADVKNPRYISGSSSLPTDELPLILAPNLKRDIGTYVVDYHRVFDYFLARFQPVPVMLYNVFVENFDNNVTAIRIFNILLTIIISLIFLSLLSFYSIKLHIKLTFLLLFLFDYIFFSYNRLAHYETLILLWSALFILCIALMLRYKSLYKRVGLSFFTGCFLSLLTLTKGHIALTVFIPTTIAFLSMVNRIFSQYRYLLFSAISSLVGFTLTTLLIYKKINIPLEFLVSSKSMANYSVFDMLSFYFRKITTYAEFSNMFAFYERAFQVYHLNPLVVILSLFSSVFFLLKVFGISNSTTSMSNSALFLKRFLFLFFITFNLWMYASNYLPTRYLTSLSFWAFIFFPIHFCQKNSESTSFIKVRNSFSFLVVGYIIFYFHKYAPPIIEIQKGERKFLESVIIYSSPLLVLLVSFQSLIGKYYKYIRYQFTIYTFFISIYQIVFFQLIDPKYDWYKRLSRDVSSKGGRYTRDIRVLNGVEKMPNWHLKSIVDHSCSKSDKKNIVILSQNKSFARKIRDSVKDRYSISANTVDSSCLIFQSVESLLSSEKQRNQTLPKRIIFSWQAIKKRDNKVFPKIGHRG